jgi:3-methylcrotonyl-CoA carboxylase alpha subunit
VVPGYAGEAQGKASAKEAKRVGYPVMIKAVAGGGGRGMRLVAREADYVAALESAQREAQAAFGDARVLLEKVIDRPRHIEVQVFGDSHGHVVHLFERDCSLQRRNQKVIEEAPAPGMSPQLRAKITDAAVACAKAVRYEGAGTVEFLVEGGKLGPGAPWYFIEMNTRLQVEHPVTEAITGLDLVEWQLRVAAGEPLPLSQAQIEMRGHAIEVRLNAEDPARAFLPSTGPILEFETKHLKGLRVDSGVQRGSVISPFYDSMIAKLIASGTDREEAVGVLVRALTSAIVAGPKTNAAFLHALITHPAFERAEMDTGLIGRELASLAPHAFKATAVAYGVRQLLGRMPEGEDRNSPWSAGDGFQLGPPRRQELTILVDGEAAKLDVRWTEFGPDVSVVGREAAGPAELGTLHTFPSGDRLYVLCNMQQLELGWPTFDAAAGEDAGDGSSIRAPIIGRVAKVFVRQGDTVAKGDRIAVVEAMKMEHVLHAGRAGRVARLAVKEGDQVTQGALVAALADA